MSRRAGLLAGAALVVVGLVWVLRGTGRLADQVMSGNGTWTVLGTIVVLVGAGAIVVYLRRPPGPPPGPGGRGR